MIDKSELEVFLPAYLSPENEQSLLENLTDFPENIDSRFYEFQNKEPQIIYQGDGIKQLMYISLPSMVHKLNDSIILSNTCDLDQRNLRMAKTSILYAPIIKLENYIGMLGKLRYKPEQIQSHISDIKKQRITQIFYLPASHDIQESIIFFDKICHCDSEVISRETLGSVRIFSLSQYGFYLLLFKLSIHFTRLHESVDRYHQT